MTLDRHTPCPVCASSVLALFDAARVLVMKVVENRTDAPGEVRDAADVVTDWLLELAPWVDAHRHNQLHSLSPELESARHPRLAA